MEKCILLKICVENSCKTYVWDQLVYVLWYRVFLRYIKFLWVYWTCKKLKNVFSWKFLSSGRNQLLLNLIQSEIGYLYEVEQVWGSRIRLQLILCGLTARLSDCQTPFHFAQRQSVSPTHVSRGTRLKTAAAIDYWVIYR